MVGDKNQMIDYHTIEKIQIGDNKYITEFLNYKGESYWWYINNDIIYSLMSKSNLRNKVSDKIMLVISSYFHILFLIYDVILQLSYSLISHTSHEEKKIPLNTGQIVFTHIYHHRWLHLPNQMDKKRIKNIFYDDVICKFPANLSTIPIYDYTYNPVALIMFDKIHKHYCSSVDPMIKYTSLKIWKEELEALQHFKQMYSKLLEEGEYLSCLSSLYGVSMSDLKKLFKYELLFVIPFCIKYNKLFEKQLACYSPSLLFLVSEQTPQGRGWVKRGKKYAIPSVALQHGSMALNDPVYYQNAITPDLTLVWSEYELNILVNTVGYQLDTVKVVGNPRFDRLSNADTLYSKNKFLQCYNLNPHHRYVLWATEFYGNSEAEIRKYLDEVFSAIRDLKNISLIIKPHPIDGTEYLTMVKAYIDNYQISVIIMPKESDITEQIYISDLVLIKTSTVGEEAVILHKPLIELNLDSERIWRNYVAEGVAIGVYKEGILRDTIETALSSESPITMVNQDRYIHNHMYDGNASGRVRDSIMEALNLPK